MPHTSDDGKNRKPNILFIMSDDHAPAAIGVYNSRLAVLNLTPNLDSLAKDGVIFDNVFVTNSICAPSRASILTGQYSQTNGVLDLRQSLDSTQQYLPQVMRGLGYESAVIGKWHLKLEPSAFDFYSVMEGHGKYHDPVFRTKGEKDWPNNEVDYKGYVSDIVTDQSLGWLKNRDHEKPFFLMHHFKAPHDMFDYAKRYEKFLEAVKIPEPDNLYDRKQWGSEATRGKNDSLIHEIGTSIGPRHTVRNYAEIFLKDLSGQPANTLKHLAYQKYLKAYLRCVKGVDDNLKRLFDYLKESGQWDNTIIVYTSDQGMILGEHDLQDKRWMYEESIKMPFIVHHSKKFKGNQRNDLLVNNTDFAPTLIELAGGKVPNYMQGNSFANYINTNHKPENWREATYYRYWMHLTHHDVPAHFGVRSKTHKLIFFYARPFDEKEYGEKTLSWLEKTNYIRKTPVAWELYDLTKDPDENHNVYGQPEYAEVTKKMKDEILRQKKLYNETDEKYPKIQEIIDKYWDK